MREYRLYTINYMTDLNKKTNSYEEMKERVEEIKQLVKENKDGEKTFFEGAYIVILENGKEIKSFDYYDLEKESE